MKNKMTTTIDLDQLLAEINENRKSGKLSERSVVKLTLEWELDVDGNGVEPVKGDVVSTAEDGPAAQKETAAPVRKPDWRSTLAQFPNE